MLSRLLTSPAVEALERDVFADETGFWELTVRGFRALPNFSGLSLGLKPAILESEFAT